MKKVIKLFLTFLGNCFGAALALVLLYLGIVCSYTLLDYIYELFHFGYNELIINILLILILLFTAFLINRAICRVGNESKTYSAIYMIVSMMPYFMAGIGVFIFAMKIAD